MRSLIQRLLSSLLTIALILCIAGCLLRFTPNSEPPEPKITLVEAPIVRTIRIIVAWFKGGGGGTEKGGSKSALPEPPQPK